MKVSRRINHTRRGVAAVELAVVLPFLVALFLGVVEFARFGMAVQLLTTAAREGCRVASLPDTTATAVQSQVASVLQGSGITVATSGINPQPSNWASASQGTVISLTLSVPYSEISWLAGTTFLPGTNVTATAAFCSEKP